MKRSSIAFDLMTYPALLRRLRTELAQLEGIQPATYRGGALEASYARLRAIARELEVRGLQGRLDV